MRHLQCIKYRTSHKWPQQRPCFCLSLTNQASFICVALNILIFQTPTEQPTELWAQRSNDILILPQTCHVCHNNTTWPGTHLCMFLGSYYYDKHHDLRRQWIYFTFQFPSHTITGGDTKQKPGDRNQSRSCGDATYCFLCLACSASFLKQSRATCPWAVPPEVGFSLPYQSRKCQPRLAYKQSGWRHFLRSGYSRQGTVAWV